MTKYTEEEILCLFREVKDKQEEILILVDLTLKDENEIRKIVGVSPVENPKKPCITQKKRRGESSTVTLNATVPKSMQGLSELNKMRYIIS